METLNRILSEHPFFKGLEEHYLELIVGCSSNVRFDAGKSVFRTGEEANEFYLIRHGKVALEVDIPGRDPISVETVGEGEILGWAWLIPPYHWHFDARAVELTRAIALDGKCLREKCEKDHDLGYQLLKRFAYIIEQRLEAARLQLLDVYSAHS